MIKLRFGQQGGGGDIAMDMALTISKDRIDCAADAKNTEYFQNMNMVEFCAPNQRKQQHGQPNRCQHTDEKKLVFRNMPAEKQGSDKRSRVGKYCNHESRKPQCALLNI